CRVSELAGSGRQRAMEQRCKVNNNFAVLFLKGDATTSMAFLMSQLDCKVTVAHGSIMVLPTTNLLGRENPHSCTRLLLEKLIVTVELHLFGKRGTSASKR
ncbi:unnamed protein product, partial [Musa hybrid cultivar]